jgi:Flp pilus assembly protein TadD
MVPRLLSAVIFLWILAAANAVAQQDEEEVSFSGKVLADGRPVNWTVEVRLEREDSSLITITHTSGSDTFKFSLVMLRKYEKSYLVIKEPGFKELRYPINFDDFLRTSSYDPIEQREKVRYYNKGIFILDLVRSTANNEGGQSQPKGPKAVNVDQILPKNAQREYDLATKAFANGDTAAALKHFEKVVELAPKNFSATSKLGIAYLKAGQHEKAEAMFNRARAIDPKDLNNLTNLGTLYIQQGDTLTSSTPGKTPANGDAASEPAKALYRKAVEVLEEALLLDPQAPRSNFYLGTALYKIGSDERAESLLINALALDKQMQEARLSLLNIYIRQKRYDAALKQIAAYLEANPNSPQREQLEKFKSQIESAISR